MIDFEKDMFMVIPFRDKETEPLNMVMGTIIDEFGQIPIIVAETGCRSKKRFEGARMLCEKYKGIFASFKLRGIFSKTYCVNIGFKWMMKHYTRPIVGMFDADNITGEGMGEWSRQQLEDGLRVVVSMNCMRCGKKSMRQGRYSEPAIIRMFGPVPLDPAKRLPWIHDVAAAQFKGEDMDVTKGCCSYNMVMRSQVFLDIRGQDETMFGYWHDQPDLCGVLESNDYDYRLCPRRCFGYHINHYGDRPPIYKACQDKWHLRRDRYEKGEPVLSNETIDEWGQYEEVKIYDYYGETK